MPNTTYDGPGASEKDTVRFLLQDTDMQNALFTDEEIIYTIDQWYDVQGSYEYCASILADRAAAKYAREASYSADGVSINLAQVAQQFRDLAVNLRSEHARLLVGGTPDVGGISPYEGLLPGIRNFAFGTGMHDDLEAGPQDYGNRDQVYYLAENEPGA